MSFSEKLYRYLLLAYPRPYRRRYAEPMLELFRDRLREARTLTDVAALWMRTLADWAVAVPARHWERISPPHASLLSQPALQCLFFARSEASSFSRAEMTVEHLLLGILRQEPTLISHVALDPLVHAIEAGEPTGRRLPPMETLPLSKEAVRAVAFASKMAHAADRQVTPQELAAGILRQPATLAARLLRSESPNP